VATEQRERVVEQIRDDAARVAARLNRDHADLVEVVVRLVENEAWEGYRSPEHWLVVNVGLSPARAREVVRIASRREQVPAMVKLLGQGRVSVDQAAVVARRAPASHQASVAESAEQMTVPQLTRVLGRYVFTVPDAATDSTGQLDPQTVEQRAAASATVSTHYDENGRFHLRYSAPADVGAVVEQAIKEAKDALFTAGQSDASHADAIAEMAARSLAAVRSTGRRDRYRVYVHLSTDGAWVNGAGAIPPALAGKFACDATIQTIRDQHGRPVSVGRAQRIVPDRTRRLIEDRDRGCRYPGCTTTRFVEIHHLKPWSQGGGTDYDTNVSLCPHHHDQLHRGEYTITGDPTRPDGLVFRHRRGLPIAAPPPPADSHPDPPRDEPRPYTPPTGEAVDYHWIRYDPDPARRLVNTS
jgi:hypothetical protein